MRRHAVLILLGLVVLASVGLRAYRIESPCAGSCATPQAQSLIFDETYYVNAARRIDGRATAPGAPYAQAPSGVDPNAEHPQLGKLAIAAGIAVFGDRPLGYRFGSLVAGTIALVLLFLVVVAAGASRWLALAATAVMAADPLFLVHGRIATLDIYLLVFLLGAALAYLRGRPVVAGVVLGVGMCVKLVSVYALFALGLLELLRWLAARRDGQGGTDALPRLAICIAVTGVAYVAVLAGLDRAVPAWDAGQRFTNPVTHTRHMLDVATALVQGDRPAGASSRPWDWITGRGAIDFLNVGSTVRAGDRVVEERAVIRFRGEINPFLIAVAIPALLLAAALALRRENGADRFAVAWFGGFFVAFCLQSVFDDRLMYIHYALAFMPALYLAGCRMFAALPRAAQVGWGLALFVGLVQLYPFRDVL